jgi:hypothetical protein
MKRLLTLLYIIAIFLFTSDRLFAQREGPQFRYRPIYGYARDTCTNKPVPGAIVFSFDSVDEARRAQQTLIKTKDPIGFNKTGRITETITDETGRYLLPALNEGALLIYYPQTHFMALEEVGTRISINVGGKKGADEDNVKVSKPKPLFTYVPADKRHKFNFSFYFPNKGEKRSDCRLYIERHVEDLETGEKLSVTVPVVRDGKAYHKKMKKLIAKKVVQDTLYDVAKRFKVLSDTTYNVRVNDVFDPEPWEDRCFRVGYVIKLDNAGVLSDLDTLYMLTNRVDKPLKHLEYEFAPYSFEPESYKEDMRVARRKLELKGEYTGKVPGVLLDSAYILTGLHVKAILPANGEYSGNLAYADTLLDEAMADLREKFASKLNEDVLVTRTTETAREGDAESGVSAGPRVEYRYVFRVERRFSEQEYMGLFAKAETDEEVEQLCIRALEESEILTRRKWDYAANRLASLMLKRGEVDPILLDEFVEPSLKSCGVRYEDVVARRPIIRNRPELLANQVLMLMKDGQYGKAASIAEILPAEYKYLYEVARCKAGYEPILQTEVSCIASSSLRNRVIMDMYTGRVGASTLEALAEMPGDDPMRWYLEARTLCILCDDSVGMMKSRAGEDGVLVYDKVKDCLKKCFELDGNLVQKAVLDKAVNEFALKEVLGVYVL